MSSGLVDSYYPVTADEMCEILQRERSRRAHQRLATVLSGAAEEALKHTYLVGREAAAMLAGGGGGGGGSPLRRCASDGAAVHAEQQRKGRMRQRRKAIMLADGLPWAAGMVMLADLAPADLEEAQELAPELRGVVGGVVGGGGGDGDDEKRRIHLGIVRSLLDVSAGSRDRMTA